ncbi:MAG: hypothetical protein AB7I27_11150 [Bacteriovoracaceae bacterium]
MNTLAVASIVIQFIGPCDSNPILNTNLSRRFINVGVASVSTLTEHKIPFEGSEKGINSVFGTPTGLSALEVISDNEMRSYGWCYSVNNEIPQIFPNQYSLSSSVSEIKWFYGYAHYLNGEWISQCEPAYKLKPTFLCK